MQRKFAIFEHSNLGGKFKYEQKERGNYSEDNAIFGYWNRIYCSDDTYVWHNNKFN